MAAEKFDIIIQRTKVTDTQTGKLVTGKIYLNGELLGNTYENDRLKIPIGFYKGALRYSSNHNFVQSENGKLAHQGDFLIEVSGVRKRTNILFHSGNKPQHSQGCILLGPATKSADGTAKIAVDHPLRQLRLKFYGTDNAISSPNKEITITIAEIIRDYPMLSIRAIGAIC